MHYKPRPETITRRCFLHEMNNNHDHFLLFFIIEVVNLFYLNYVLICDFC